MVVLQRRIGLKDIRALKPGEIIWDGVVGGFHARRQKSNTVSYIVVYRTAEGRQRWQTIGRHGSPWTPTRLAMRQSASSATLSRVVIQPQRSIRSEMPRACPSCATSTLPTLRRGDSTRRKVAKKLSTIATDRGRVKRHIKPLLGNMKVAAVTREDIDGFMHAVAEGKTVARIKTAKKRGLANVRGGKGTASRTVGLLGAIFSYAVRHRIRPTTTPEGQVLAGVLIFLGIGLIGFASARLTSKWLNVDDGVTVLGAKVSSLEREIVSLRDVLLAQRLPNKSKSRSRGTIQHARNRRRFGPAAPMTLRGANRLVTLRDVRSDEQMRNHLFLFATPQLAFLALTASSEPPTHLVFID